MLCISLLDLLLCFSMTGCGADPLVIRKNDTNGPWCAPNRRVQFGQRVVGHVGFGENKWKIFLVDDAGKEYDPAKLADQVWSYLERTGDAKIIKEAFTREAYYPGMTIVSIKPIVVILEPNWNADLRKRIGTSPERYHWLALVSAERYPPSFKEGLQWFSPDLKQRPTDLAFSRAGVAEISLKNGKLKLIRAGGDCKITRE
jgi:hypothetical protein